MSLARLQFRVPSTRKVDVARLSSHKLMFHKVGGDNSAKCDAMHTGDLDDVVIGVVYHIEDSEKSELDRIEGLGHGYDEKTVKVITPANNTIVAKMYYATKIDAALNPFRWYKEHVLIGARENGLPKEYIDQIERIKATDDVDRKRNKLELSIYG